MKHSQCHFISQHNNAHSHAVKNSPCPRNGSLKHRRCTLFHQAQQAQNIILAEFLMSPKYLYKTPQYVSDVIILGKKKKERHFSEPICVKQDCSWLHQPLISYSLESFSDNIYTLLQQVSLQTLVHKDTLVYPYLHPLVAFSCYALAC